MLIEHWSDKAQFDIHRFAHYLIDLDMQYPEYEKLPIALFTDTNKEWNKKPPLEIQIKCLDEIFLSFRYRLIRMKDYEAERYRNTKNKFIAVLRSAMQWGKTDKIVLAVDLIQLYSKLEKDIKNAVKNLDIIEYFLYITEEEKRKITEIFKENRNNNMTIAQELIKIGEAKGLQEGLSKGKLEDAKKMHEKGIAAEIIIEITGLTREDLEKIGIFVN